MPVDIALVLKNGGCMLLADVMRNPAGTDWLQAISRLTVGWGEVPTEVMS